MLGPALKLPIDRRSFEAAVSEFTLDGLGAQFVGSLQDGLNACVECCAVIPTFADPLRE
jgi:hypothetical protein